MPKSTVGTAASMVTIQTIDDLANAEKSVGLPVGPRGSRTKEKKEWYVLLKLMRQAIPLGIFELPADVRCGNANAISPEPDFVMSRANTNDMTALVEVTEATDEADQRERFRFQLSGKTASLLGEFGGRFPNGASHPETTWASDIIEAVKRKAGKTIFKASPVQRHLLVYPNSNASILMFDEDDERQGIEHLRQQFANDEALLRPIANGCLVHILGNYVVCLDAFGKAIAIPRN